MNVSTVRMAIVLTGGAGGTGTCSLGACLLQRASHLKGVAFDGCTYLTQSPRTLTPQPRPHTLLIPRLAAPDVLGHAPDSPMAGLQHPQLGRIEGLHPPLPL